MIKSEWRNLNFSFFIGIIWGCPHLELSFNKVGQHKQGRIVVPDPQGTYDGPRLHVVPVPPGPSGQIHVPRDHPLLQDRSHKHLVTQEELVINTQGHVIMGIQPPDGPDITSCFHLKQSWHLHLFIGPPPSVEALARLMMVSPNSAWSLVMVTACSTTSWCMRHGHLHSWSSLLFPHLVIHPGHIGDLHGGHEDVHLEPPDVQLSRGCSIVSIASNHVREDKGVACEYLFCFCLLNKILQPTRPNWRRVVTMLLRPLS